MCVLWGTGLVCWACSKITSCSMTLLVSSGAPSVSSSLNAPSFSTTFFIKKTATLSSVCCFTAIATAYIVTYSTAAMTYRSPPSVVGNQPATSSAHLSSPRRLRKGGVTFLVLTF
ncbi:hypothetical protein PR003_g13665 [Phytophthora rubi]|uniref:Uncharacterized protein n=1 Tax=Phytophthora rubi TaxID=129364 RepID=A0A6A4F508_9STRA|nr:hypothetical protein PR003_g13665 [Phytophthora rubi]